MRGVCRAPKGDGERENKKIPRYFNLVNKELGHVYYLNHAIKSF